MRVSHCKKVKKAICERGSVKSNGDANFDHAPADLPWHDEPHRKPVVWLQR